MSLILANSQPHRLALASGLFAAALLAACGPSVSSEADAQGSAADASPGSTDAPSGDAQSAENAAVYAHTGEGLYRVDPDSLEVSLVGNFSFTGTAGAVTDIAIDRAGNMLGITFDGVFAIDKTTAHATQLSSTTFGFNSLSFLPTNPADPNSPEILIAADFDGDVHEINPQTGVATVRGNFGGGVSSSGDIVSVRGFGTVATVNVPGKTNDHLAWVNPTTFAASVIGDTGVDRIFGIGFWKGTVYGFTDGGRFVTIDVSTGVATTVEQGALKWYGAGVTTSAPVVE